MRHLYVLATICSCLAAAAVERPAAIVPAPEPIAIDGDGAEWAGITAQQTIWHQGVPLARFKLAGDDKALYCLAEVADGSPLRNGTQVIEELIKGGDAISLCARLGSRGDSHQRFVAARVEGRDVVLAMRPEWKDKRPYTYTSVGTVAMDWVGVVAAAEVAFAQAPSGYRMELRLPWSLLGSAPAPGSIFPFDLQVIASDEAGLANEFTAWWHSRGSGPLATMDLATEAKLYPWAWGEARLYRRDPGALPQAAHDAEAEAAAGGAEIRFELPRAATASLVVMDQRGWIVNEPLRAQRLEAGSHVVRWNGRNRRGEILPPGTYRTLLGYWDRLEARFVASVGNSGVPSFRTADGKGSIGGSHGGPVSVAADAGGVYIGHDGQEGQRCLRKIDPDTGEALWFADCGVFGGAFALVSDGEELVAVVGRATHGVSLRSYRADNGRAGGLQRGLGKVRIADLALAGGSIWLVEGEGGRLRRCDRVSGEEQPAPALSDLRGIAARDVDTLYLITADALQLLPATGSTPETVIDGFTDLRAIAVGPDGVIHLAEGGDSQQLLRVDPTAKRVLSRSGREGGRPETMIPYDPQVYRNVRDLAIDAGGCLWFVEPSVPPRRVGRLDAEHRWLSDDYGPTGYGNVGIDLDDPTTVYYQHAQRSTSLVEARYDPAAARAAPGDPASWTVVAIHQLDGSDLQSGQRNEFMDAKAAPARSNYGRIQVFTATNGTRYLFIAKGDRRGLYRWDRRWIPAAAIGDERRSSWYDGDGDGLVDDGEVHAGGLPGGDWAWLDRDLVLHGETGSLAPAALSPSGTPIYHGGAWRPALAADQPPLTHYLDQVTYFRRPFPELETGAHFVVANVGLGSGRGFWDRADETRLAKIAEGRVQWMIGHHTGRMGSNGDNVMLMELTGVVDGVVVCSEVESNFTAYTTDGLTLGWVSRSGLERPAHTGPLAWYVENAQQGLFVKHPATGQRLLVGLSTEDLRVLEIDGVFGQDLTRVDGTVVLDAPARPRGSWPEGHVAIPAATWIRQDNRFLGVDGFDREWPRVPPTAIRDGERVVGELRLRRDGGELCGFLDVLDPDWRAAASGDPAVAPGLRLDLAAGDGDDRIVTGIAVSVVAGGARLAIRRSRAATIPAGDDLKLLRDRGALKGAGDAVELGPAWLDCPNGEVALKPRYDDGGYRLEFSLPLALLPELVAPADLAVVRRDWSGRRQRPDLVGSCPIRIGLRVAAPGGGTRLLAGGGEVSALVDAPWATANGYVQIDWQAGAERFDLLRSSAPDAALAELVAANIESHGASDLPPDTSCWYWLRPRWGDAAGQLVGPVGVDQGSVRFATYEYQPAVPLAAVEALDLAAGATATLVVASEADELALSRSEDWCRVEDLGGGTWQLTMRPGARVPDGLRLRLRHGARREAVELAVRAAPVVLHGDRAQVVAHVPVGRQQKILRHQGEGPSCRLELERGGALLRDAVGTWGHHVPTGGDWARRGGEQWPVLGWDGWKGMNYGKIQVWPRGAPKDQRPAPFRVTSDNRPGAAATLTVEPTGDQPLLLTVLMNRRNDNAAPCRWTARALGSEGPWWEVVQWDGRAGAGVFQLRVSAGLELRCTLTGQPLPDFYNLPGVAAVFADPADR